jgi:hypothetical protein
MASYRVSLMGGVVLGVLLMAAVMTLLGRSREIAPAPSEPRPSAVVEPAAPTPAPAPHVSRSKGQSDWTFFFRVGDTLSRMADGAPLGAVVRLERSHVFPDGAGPAYVVRSADQRETVFDADELERSARVEAIREIGRPPVGTGPR